MIGQIIVSLPAGRDGRAEFERDLGQLVAALQPLVAAHGGTVRWELVSAERWPAPTVDDPDMDEIFAMADDGISLATDGCTVEPDGVCPHGHPSWALYWELI
jgi:hypothetical protein